MRKLQNETLDMWASRVMAAEQALATADIARGTPVDAALSRMAIRIQKKLLHPLYAVLQQDVAVLDSATSNASYARSYLTKRTEELKVVFPARMPDVKR